MQGSLDPGHSPPATKGEHAWSAQGESLHTPEVQERARAGLHRLPEAGAPGWASPGVFAHQMSLYLPKAHCQMQVCWAQRVNGTPLRLKYAKVVTRPTSAEKKSYHMGSGGISWSGVSAYLGPFICMTRVLSCPGKLGVDTGKCQLLFPGVLWGWDGRKTFLKKSMTKCLMLDCESTTNALSQSLLLHAIVLISCKRALPPRKASRILSGKGRLPSYLFDVRSSVRWKVNPSRRKSWKADYVIEAECRAQVSLFWAAVMANSGPLKEALFSKALATSHVIRPLSSWWEFKW